MLSNTTLNKSYGALAPFHKLCLPAQQNSEEPACKGKFNPASISEEETGPMRAAFDTLGLTNASCGDVRHPRPAQRDRGSSRLRCSGLCRRLYERCV